MTTTPNYQHPWKASPTAGLSIQVHNRLGLLVASIASNPLLSAEHNARLITHAPELLEELALAHRIIKNALAVMSLREKQEWAKRNAQDCVEGEGVTRANERSALLDRVGYSFNVGN